MMPADCIWLCGARQTSKRCRAPSHGAAKVFTIAQTSHRAGASSALGFGITRWSVDGWRKTPPDSRHGGNHVRRYQPPFDLHRFSNLHGGNSRNVRHVPHRFWNEGVATRGRPRKRHIPDILSIAAEDMLVNAKWQNVSWRTGTKGKLKARFAAVRVRIADGPPQRIRDKGQQHLPGDEAWLIGEHRMSGEKKYYLANLPAAMDLRTLAATIKARWVCEQAHQQLKEELGLDHFEGRSWPGLHRHALMTMIAYVFLQNRRLAKARRGKKNRRAAASTKSASGTSRHRQSLASTGASAMSALSKMDLQRAAA
jgi:hypothetical protein